MCTLTEFDSSSFAFYTITPNACYVAINRQRFIILFRTIINILIEMSYFRGTFLYVCSNYSVSFYCCAINHSDRLGRRQ